MLKKLLLFASVASMGLAFSSCSNEIEAPVSGQDGMVVFTAKMPGSINSRAYSDGTGADKLSYAVYKAGTDEIVYSSTQDDAPQAVYNNDLTFRLQLPLVKGQKYDLIFWADKDGNSFYSFDPINKEISISYSGIECNDESRDAFFTAEKEMAVVGAMEKTIQLYRPFAQLNIGTNDLEVAARAGIVPASTQVVVKDVYSSLNLFSGEASVPADVEFAPAALPNAGKSADDADYEKFPVAGYEYLSMNYILTGEQILNDNVNSAQKETKDITITINDADGKNINEFNVSAVPFQRNYRTNIYGALLTSTVDFVIEVVPDYNKPDNDVEIADIPEGKVKFDDQLYESIPAAIAAAGEAGVEEAIIYVGEGEYIAQNELIVPAGNSIKNLSIVGVGPQTVIIKDKGYNVKSAIELTFSNLTIRCDGSNYNGFYHSGSELYDNCVIENALFLYGTTATFKGCTLNVDPEKYATTYNVWCYGAGTVDFEDCIFNSAKSILVYCENSAMSQTVNVKNCVFNGKELQDGKAAIEVDCHRLGAEYSYTLNLDNNKASGYDGGNLSGKQLWNVKDGEKFTIIENGVEIIQGITTPDRNGPIYHINSAEGLEILSALVSNGSYKDGVLSPQTFKGKELVLTADIDLENRDWAPIGSNSQGKDKNSMNWFEGTFDGAGHTISNLKCYDEGNYSVAGLFGAVRGNIKNLIIDGADIRSNHYAGALMAYSHNNNAATYGDGKAYPADGFLIENCEVRNAKVVSSPNQQDGGAYDNGDKVGVLIGYTNAIMTISGCKVSDSSVEAYRDLGALIGYIGGSNNGNLPIKINNNVAENIQLIQNFANGYKDADAVAQRYGTWYGWKDYDPASLDGNTESGVTYEAINK